MNAVSVTAKGPGRPKDAGKGQAILKAASELFLSLGYQGTSMQAIAAAAGVSKLTLYSHYQGKDELFAAAITNVCKSRLPDLLFQVQADELFSERLRLIATAIFKLTNSAESIALYRLLMGLSEQESALAELFYQAGPVQVLTALEKLLYHADACGLLKIEQPLRAAQHFLSLLNGSAHFHLTLGCRHPLVPVSEEEHVREVVALFLRAYSR